jgi:predicted glycosyltransferase involved in capsule biosynthesis
VALTVGYKIVPENATLADKIIFKLLSLSFVLFNNFLHVGVSGGEFQMIKREVFEKLRGFNEKLVAAEDGDMFSRLGKVGRTRCDISLSIYHSGRREHAVGWPRLLFQWMRNYLMVQIFGRSWSKEWTEVR